MSEQETMRLVAEVVDRYSGPLKSMMQQLQKIGDGSKSIHEKGAKNVNEHARTYKELGEQIRKVKDNGVNILTPSLAAMGVTIYGVSEGMGKLVETLKGAGERWNVLNETMKRGGVSPTYVNAIGRAFERMGMDAGKADAAVAGIGETLDKLKSNDPQEMNRLTGVFGNMLPLLGEITKGAKNREEEMTRIAGAVTDKKYPLWQRRKLAEAFGIDPALAAKSGEEFGKAFRESMQRELDHKVDPKTLEGLRDAFTHLQAAQRDYGSDMVAIFGPPGVRLVDGFASALDALGKKYRERFGGHGTVPLAPDSLFGRAASALGFKTKDPQSANERVSGAFDALTKKEQEETVARGTARGVLEAFRDWKAQSDANKFADGLKPMAFHPGGDATGGSAPRFGSEAFPNIGEKGGAFSKAQRDAIGGGGGGLPDTTGAGLAGSEFLKARRDRFAKEMQDPNVRARVKAMMQTEGTPLQSLEAALNRADYTGKSLAATLSPSFYGPMRKGDFPGIVAQMRNGGGKKYDAMIDQVLAGSNTVKGYTDQGMPTDPNGSRRSALTARDHISVREKGGLNEFTDWEGGPGGRAGARRYREALQAGIERTAERHGARLRDMVHRGGRRPPSDAELLKRGRRGSDASDALKGSLGVKIDLNGFPKGTRTAISQEGGLLKEVALYRGRTMVQGSEES
ncbi:hypothetical protein UB31_18875 [Bradyrhizobium sp. LTSP849]|uniref:hypothetical protein n=1 Tax=Bradyrhizobium sp. LTSP849 TaxID=1615890 RepID=UPI0005D25EB3|nr:hypothetical protein [Bradyrhizobium sp. LTSP849]KJC47319.1 hypothetical protein UB31_18875 [Bradyrhizobium sp. LTSP849]